MVQISVSMFALLAGNCILYCSSVHVIKEEDSINLGWMTLLGESTNFLHGIYSGRMNLLGESIENLAKIFLE